MRRVLAVPVAAMVLGAAAFDAAPVAAARGPQVSIFPSSVSFGSQPVGSVQQRSVSVQNYGDAPLHVHSVFVNDFSGSYSLVFNSCTGATVRRPNGPSGLTSSYRASAKTPSSSSSSRRRNSWRPTASNGPTST